MSGVEGLVAGAALSLPFNALYDVVKQVVLNANMFSSQLSALDSRVSYLKPVIDDLEKYNNQLGRNVEEAKQLEEIAKRMEDGKKLIDEECSKVGRWNILKRYTYTNKLVDLDDSLSRLSEILKMHGLVVGKETLITAKRIDAGMNVLVQNQSDMQILVKEIHNVLVNYGSWRVMFAVFLVSMVMVIASKDTKWFVFNVGNNTLTFNN
ncbi:hypothetical protein M0R45_001452 [Rubus argutus]|uniref:RPW8 domain-containing protein n=1 Tax=Rubus argutus TaxID=59490 RepID=A0AAW1VM86_RUBAR